MLTPCKNLDIIRHYLNKNDDVHTYNTRTANTDFGKRSLKYRAAKYYNDLPEEIKFKLDDSWRYNKSVLSNYLFNIDH